MKKMTLIFLVGSGLILFSTAAIAQELIVFPAEGQTDEQMEKDKYECYSWAKKQTGFDPMEIPTATAPPPEEKAGKGGALKGAAAGAAVGAVGGKIAGKSASRGAGYGAAAGGLLGGMHQSSQQMEDERAKQQWAQEQSQQYARARSEYNRAYAACLEGKGYTVK
ncbi:MAG TPA: YMGG-like glycine zipper-containing protein [Deltaproteobacteria bacterium]|jgi:hypothetical protein|nr:YMGG-like glycine zipper-containing protein [Deltaproteobacteria bacterium]